MATGIHRGNPLIRAHNTKYAFNKHELLEFKRCKEDPIYFIENYIYIINLNDGKTLFKLYDFQKEMITSYKENNRVVVVSGRQQGKSITSASFLLWFAIFRKDKTTALLANKASTAKEILSRVNLMLECLPFFLQPGCRNINKSSIEFSNGSEIFCAATSSSSIRGRAVDVVLLDEFAFIENAEDFYTSTYPVISSGRNSKIIMTSTPCGFNLFHKFYNDAIQSLIPGPNFGKSAYVALKYTWRDDPTKDTAWERVTRASMSHQQFQQEFESDFLGGSNTLISSACISAMTSKTPIKSAYEGKLNYYAEPKEDRSYVATVDVAHGRGFDYSTFTIFDITEYPFTTVCTFRDNKISPLMFPNVISHVAMMYNEAWVLVESNDIGLTIINSLNDDLEYENIIPSLDGKDFGVRTTKSVKANGCSNLKDLMECNKLTTNDANTIAEIANFIAKRFSYEADKGHHDDLVMNLVLFAWLTGQIFFEELRDAHNLRDDIFGDSIEEMEASLLPFHVISHGEEEGNIIEFGNIM